MQSDAAPSLVSCTSAVWVLRVCDTWGDSFERSICSQVPAFARDRTPFRTKGELWLGELGSLSMSEALQALTTGPAGILPGSSPDPRRLLFCRLLGLDSAYRARDMWCLLIFTRQLCLRPCKHLWPSLLLVLIMDFGSQIEDLQSLEVGWRNAHVKGHFTEFACNTASWCTTSYHVSTHPRASDSNAKPLC